MEITLTDVTSGYNLSKINNNFKILQDAINNRLVHRDGTNELEADLDFNSHKAINVGSLIVDGKDIIEEINNAYDSIEDFLVTTDNLLREIEAILSGQLQDRNQGNGQYSTQLLEDITEGTVYTIPNGLQYIVGRNSLRISYQGVLCYPTYQYDEVGTFDEASNQIKFNITIPAHSHLNIWISGVGNIVQIKEDLEAAFAEYTNYVTTTKAEIESSFTEYTEHIDNTKAEAEASFAEYTEYVNNTKSEVEAMKSSVDASEANVTTINSSVQETAVKIEEWNTTSLEAANNSKTWAEGTDEEVVAIGGEHSSKTWSLLAKEYAEIVEQIKQQIGTPINVQGRVDNVQSLPSSGNKNGDMYFVGPESSDDLSEYVWINNKWEFLGKLGVTVPDASESEKGIVKLATQSEITNRTGNNVVVASKLPTNIDWSKVDNKPSTISGYGITDAYTKTDVYTKAEVYTKEEVYPRTNVYTKTEVYNKTEVYPKADVYTKTETDDKIAAIPEQVNADWNSSSGKSQILNKPEIVPVRDTGLSSTIAVQENTVYVRGTLSSLTLSSIAASDKESLIYFTTYTGSNFSLSLPTGTKYIGVFTFSPSTQYVISILSGIVVMGEVSVKG